MNQNHLLTRLLYLCWTAVTVSVRLLQMQPNLLQSVFTGVGQLIFGMAQFSHVMPFLCDCLQLLLSLELLN